MRLGQIPAEFRLVAACCRWPDSAGRNAEIGRIAAGAIDWDLFLRVAGRHRVEGLVHRALAQAGAAIPEAARTALGARAEAIAADNLRQAAECARLKGLLEAAGLSHLFVKGVTLAMLAYGSLSAKQAWDVDLLVLPGEVMAAAALLKQAGYVRLVPEGELSDEQFETWIALYKESLWRNEANGIAVELHTSLSDNPALLPGVTARTEPRQVERGASITLPTLKDETLFTYLCVHGAVHGWSRLKWLADVAALLSTRDAEAIERLYEWSLVLGAGRSSAQALLLCSALLDMKLPPRLQAELTRDRKARWLVGVAVSAMVGSGPAELDEQVFGTLRINVSHFFLERGVRYKLSEFWRKVSNPEDRMKVNLPRPLHFAYSLVAIPRWVWRRWKVSATGPTK